jgi:hypothetical protein
MSNSIHVLGVVTSFSRDIAGYILFFESADVIVSENGAQTSNVVQGVNLGFQITLSSQLCSVFAASVGRQFECEVFAPSFRTLLSGTIEILDESAVVFNLSAPSPKP